MRWIKWTVGFLAGVAVAVVFELVLMGVLGAVFHARAAPRGIGWLVFLVCAGLAAGRLASTTDVSRYKLPTDSIHLRVAAAATLSWWVCVVAYLWIAAPYGNYAPLGNAFDSIRIGTTMRWLMGPPIAAAAIFAIFLLVARPPRDRAESATPPGANE